jgi:hypothetical protein
MQCGMMQHMMQVTSCSSIWTASLMWALLLLLAVLLLVAAALLLVVLLLVALLGHPAQLRARWVAWGVA